MRRDLEAHRVAVSEHIAAGDLPPHAVDLLVDRWFSLADIAERGVQDQVPSRIHFQAIDTVEANRNPTVVSAGMDDEVVLKLQLIAAVVDQVNARIELLVSHLGICRQIGAPLRRILADEVVDPGRQWSEPRYAWSWISVRQHHSHYG